jgi:hypothetical protein
VGGDGAHLGVDHGGEALDVGGVGAAEVVDLIVDVDGDGLALVLGGCLGGFEGLVHRVSFALRLEELVHLLEHLLDSEANGVALFIEGGEFGFYGARVALICGDLLAEGGDFGLGGGAGFAFTLDDLDGAEDFLLERLKLVDTNGGCAHTHTYEV